MLPNGEAAALVLDESAFHEDCARAQVVISPLFAPRSCTPKILLDRARLAETDAVTLSFDRYGAEWRMARAPGEDRPWTRAPPRRVAAIPAAISLPAIKAPIENDAADEDLPE